MWSKVVDRGMNMDTSEDDDNLWIDEDIDTVGKVDDVILKYIYVGFKTTLSRGNTYNEREEDMFENDELLDDADTDVVALCADNIVEWGSLGLVVGRNVVKIEDDGEAVEVDDGVDLIEDEGDEVAALAVVVELPAWVTTFWGERFKRRLSLMDVCWCISGVDEIGR